MKKNPLVTVTIPTLNSESFIAKCIDAIRNQTYPNIEINVIDGGSSDSTIRILKEKGVSSIYKNKGSLLACRYEGVLKSKGDYILLLDSDQILDKEAIEKAVKTSEGDGPGILVFGETVYSDKTFLEKLFKYDKELIHKIRDLNPYTSVLLPRFFKRKILIEAMNNIPKKVIREATPQDHAIIFFETWKIDRRVVLIENCIRHIEADSILRFFKKNYRWGYYSVFIKPSDYRTYFEKRTKRFRNGLFTRGMFIQSLASITLLLLKGFPYELGVVVSRLERL